MIKNRAERVDGIGSEARKASDPSVRDIGLATTTAMRELGLPCIHIATTETPSSITFAYFIATAVLTRIKKAQEALNIVLASVAHSVTFSPLTDHIDGANIALTIIRKKQAVIVLESVTEPLGAFDYALGMNIVNGIPEKINLLDVPHLLVCGASGTGKSTFLHSVINSIVNNPESEVGVMLVDTKKVEFNIYRNEAYKDVICPYIANTPEEAYTLLLHAYNLMQAHYNDMQERGLREWDGVRQVLIIDEYADLLQQMPRLKDYIVRIAQMGRAAGIHLIIATQRPSVDVVDGIIKANFPCRLAFRTASKIDSRVILDDNGAETLRGNGEAIYRNHIGETKKVQTYIANNVKNA